MVRIKDIIQHLEQLAPPALQESYDNSGLLTGDRNSEVTNALITLDATEAVIDEAIATNCNLVIAHHPIIFKGLKSITGKNYVERVIIKAIQNNISIYAIHTNLDNVMLGVNNKICEKIGLNNRKILAPKSNVLSTLVVFVPKENTEEVKKALFAAGAGEVGNYDECAFTIEGTGQFTPNADANPTIGEHNLPEFVNENRIEVLVPTHALNKVISSMQNAHPYEEVAYYTTPLLNSNQEVGSGMVGSLEHPMESAEFLLYLKEKMNLNCIRHTPLLNKKVKKVAVCGGSGSFLLSKAKAVGADVFITADFKYHEFFDAEGELIIADIGHYESEVFTKDLIYEFLSKKFTSFALNLSKSVTNPISYL